MKHATLAIIAAALCIAAAPPAPARPIEARPHAQPENATDAHADDEIARLTRENERLRRLHRETLARIADLEAMNRELRDQLERADLALARLRAPSAEAWPDGAAPTGDGPLASPHALLAALRERYETDLAALPLDGTRDEQAYLELVRAWCDRVTRELAGPIDWFVRIEQIERIDARRHEALLTVIDPALNRPLGTPVRLEIPGAFGRSVARRDDGSLWRMRGRLAADPVFNPDRTEPGLFNYPAFLGRYAEFGMSIDWRHLRESTDEELRRVGERRRATASEPTDAEGSPEVIER